MPGSISFSSKASSWRRDQEALSTRPCIRFFGPVDGSVQMLCSIQYRTTRSCHLPPLDFRSNGVYPGFPTLFWGLSVFFVGDLMGKALWKLVENAARFPRRGGRVLCVHGAVSFHRARPCGQDGSQGGGPCVMSSWTAASSDCSRPVNNYVHVKTVDLYRPNARLTPERQGYQVLTPFGKLGYSRQMACRG